MPYPTLTRRGFLATTAAAGAAKFIPKFASGPAGRRIVQLYYDKALGAMRLVEKAVR